MGSFPHGPFDQPNSSLECSFHRQGFAIPMLLGWPGLPRGGRHHRNVADLIETADVPQFTMELNPNKPMWIEGDIMSKMHLVHQTYGRDTRVQQHVHSSMLASSTS